MALYNPHQQQAPVMTVLDFIESLPIGEFYVLEMDYNQQAQQQEYLWYTVEEAWERIDESDPVLRAPIRTMWNPQETYCLMTKVQPEPDPNCTVIIHKSLIH